MALARPWVLDKRGWCRVQVGIRNGSDDIKASKVRKMHASLVKNPIIELLWPGGSAPTDQRKLPLLMVLSSFVSWRVSEVAECRRLRGENNRACSSDDS